MLCENTSGKIRGTNLTNLGSDGGDVRREVSYDISDGDHFAIDNTALGCWFNFPGPRGQKDMFHVFYQTDSGEIVEAIRDLVPDNNTVPGVGGIELYYTFEQITFS